MAIDPRRRRKFILVALLIPVVLFVATELLIRTVYAVRNSRVTKIAVPYYAAHTFAELPPWYDGLRTLERDPDLLWRTRPGIRRSYVDVFSPAPHVDDRVALERAFIPDIPEDVDAYPTWELVVNAQGFRDDEFPAERPESQLRIVCMGDSWTFGVNVDQGGTYPARLEALLRETYPGLDVEVLNLGVMGYSTFQGLELLRRTGLALEPDVVMIGFGMNDGQLSPWSDEELVESSNTLPARIGRAIKKSEVAMLARYAGRLAFSGYKPPGQRIEAAARRMRAGEPGGRLPRSRVAPEAYERNVREMIALARARGADVVLLFNELRGVDGIAPPLEAAYREALGRISQEEGVPLVDTSALLAEARQEIERELEARYGLAPAGAAPGDAARAATPPGPEDGGPGGSQASPPATGVDVVFRAREGEAGVTERLYIAGAHEAMGNTEPNAVPMHDDGTHGDERAGDGVWSWTGRFEPGEALAYVYTNSGARGEWEGIDVPYVRMYRVDDDAAGTVYAPIETFGDVYLLSDGNHADGDGLALIAERALEALHEIPGFPRRVEGGAR